MFRNAVPCLLLVLSGCFRPAGEDEVEDPSSWDGFEAWDEVPLSPSTGSFGGSVERTLILDLVAAADYFTSGNAILTILALTNTSAPSGGVALPGRSLRVNACLPGPSDTCTDGDPIGVSLGRDVAPVGTVSDKPFAIGILLDSSGSMSSNDPGRLRVEGARGYVELLSGLQPGSRFAVGDFGAGADNGFSVTRLLADFTTDRDVLDAAISRTTASGGTPLFDSLYEMIQFVDDEVSDDDYERAMLLLSDGKPNDTNLRQDCIDYANDNHIPVNTVALVSGDLSLAETMRDLARETGGIASVASSATSLSDAFEGIAASSRYGYAEYLINFPEDYRPGEPTTVIINAGGEDVPVLFDPR